MQLRCSSRIHGVLEDGHLEVKCHSKHCGASRGVTVLHYFNLDTGKLIETKRFKSPTTMFDHQLANKEQ